MLIKILIIAALIQAAQGGSSAQPYIRAVARTQVISRKLTPSMASSTSTSNITSPFKVTSSSSAEPALAVVAMDGVASPPQESPASVARHHGRRLPPPPAIPPGARRDARGKRSAERQSGDSRKRSVSAQRAPHGSPSPSASFDTMAREEAEAVRHVKELRRKLTLAELQVAHVSDKAREASIAYEFKDHEAERARSLSLQQSRHLIGLVEEERVKTRLHEERAAEVEQGPGRS